MRLAESFPGQLLKLSKVLCASSYGHFIARKEFWSQCHVLLFLMSGGPRADELDLEVDFGVVLGFAFYLQHICVRSTSGRLVSQPRPHRPLSLHITNGT